MTRRPSIGAPATTASSNDVEYALRLASELGITNPDPDDELGEPYIEHPTFNPGPAAALVCFCCALFALALCVVVAQVARHWLGLGELAAAAYLLYLAALAGDWLFGRVAGWLR